MNEKYSQLEKDYFEQELLYLYDRIQEFSKFFPDTASKLEFNLHGSEDPHIQFMLESFAILTSKLQKQIDQSTYPISSTILDNIHPVANLPIPSKAIVKFEIDESQIGSLSKGFKIPKGTLLFKQIDDETFCKFTTEVDLKLLPIEVNSFHLEDIDSSASKATIVIDLKAIKCKFSDIKTNIIPLYVNAPKYISTQLFDIIFDEETDLYIKDKKSNSVFKIRKNNLNLKNFDSYSEIDPLFKRVHDSTRLIRDFFSLREKFYFFEIESNNLMDLDENIELQFVYNKKNHKELLLKKNYIAINCVPIINLYRKNSEPLKLDKHKFQFRIYSNYHNKKIEKLYSILDVFYIGNENENEKIYPITDFFAGYEDKMVFYEIKRCVNNSDDIYLNFYDKSGIILYPDEKTIYCNILATNGKIAENIKEKDKFDTDVSFPIKNIEVVRFASNFLDNRNNDIHQWEILANFNYNNIPLFDENYFIEKIRNLIYINGLRKSEKYNEVNRILDLVIKTNINKKQMKKNPLHWEGYADACEFILTLKNEKIREESVAIIGMLIFSIIKSYLPINNGLSLTMKTELNEKIIFHREFI